MDNKQYMYCTVPETTKDIAGIDMTLRNSDRFPVEPQEFFSKFQDASSRLFTKIFSLIDIDIS
jgi:hypothetical protein